MDGEKHSLHFDQPFGDFVCPFFTLLEAGLVFSFVCSPTARAGFLLDALPASNIRRLPAHPTRLICGTRAIANESAGTSCVTVVPAAIYAPRPTVTGATSCVSVPTDT